MMMMHAVITLSPSDFQGRKEPSLLEDSKRPSSLEIPWSDPDSWSTLKPINNKMIGNTLPLGYNPLPIHTPTKHYCLAVAVGQEAALQTLLKPSSNLG